MRALADHDPQYDDQLKRGRPYQKFLAKQLHQEAGVPEDPCGHQEIQAFQDYLGDQGYQILVFEGQQGALWFKDRAFNEAPKKMSC